MLSSATFAFSTSNIQLLYGDFDGNSYVYDTNNGAKTTITAENFTSIEYGTLYMFADYCIADDKFKYHDDKTDLYGEIAPRINLSTLSGKDLSHSIVKQLYVSFQYNAGDKYNAFLYGMGVDLEVGGFDVLGVDMYRKNQNIGKDTYQLTAFYTTKKLKDMFYMTGFVDWTEYDVTTQNQFLADILKVSDMQKLSIGTEWHYYTQKPLDLNFQTRVVTNVFQAMIKYSW